MKSGPQFPFEFVKSVLTRQCSTRPTPPTRSRAPGFPPPNVREFPDARIPPSLTVRAGNLSTIIASFMGPKDILERTASSEAVEFVPPETEYGLNVVSVYQDIPTRNGPPRCATRWRNWPARRGPLLFVGNQPPERSRGAHGGHPDDVVADVIMVSIYDAKNCRLNSAGGLTCGCRPLPADGSFDCTDQRAAQPGGRRTTPGITCARLRAGAVGFPVAGTQAAGGITRFLLHGEARGMDHPTTSVIQEALSHEQEPLSCPHARFNKETSNLIGAQ